MEKKEKRFRCIVCERAEDECDCDKYCSLCLGFDDVRLVQDGRYYCLACREACEYYPED